MSKITNPTFKILYKFGLVKYLSRKNLALVVCTVISALLIGMYLFKDKITSESEVIEVHGKLAGYSFKITEPWIKSPSKYIYYIFLHGYNNGFKIHPDYLGDFEDEAFKSMVRNEDPVTITIPKKQEIMLNEGIDIKVTSIKANHRYYLSLNDVIKSDQSPGLIYGAFIFFVWGIIYFKLSG